MKRFRYLIWLLPFAMAIIIFRFSAQPGDESSQLSGTVVLKILEILARLNISEIPEKLMNILTTLVRKAAHMTEYTVLYGTLLAAWFVTGLRKNKWMFFSVLTVFLYACTDEFHQLFIPGRSGQFTDVLIDCSVPVIISVLLWLHFHRSRVKT